MSYRRDYFQNQMDQMARVLGKLLADLLGLKSEGKILEANDLTLEVFSKDIGFDFEEIKTTPPERLVDFLIEKKQFSDEHIQHIANILFELGMEKDPSTGSGQAAKESKRVLYSRAYVLYEYLNSVGTTFSFDFLLKMNRIKEELD
ncbi:MAG: hypothetical protein Q8M29_06285 [Bacteroidota bacterium]|nr:hypothetical protein [Bacteroidota bacterium]